MIYIRLLQILVFLKIILQSEELESTPEESILVTTEKIIRNSLNDVFALLRVRGVKNSTEIRQNSLIHDFFTSLALRDHGALRDVSALARANSGSNSSDAVLQQLHEVLLEDSLGDLADSLLQHLDVITFIRNFLEQLSFKYTEISMARKVNSEDVFDRDQKVNKSVDNEKSVRSDDDDDSGGFWELSEWDSRRIYRGTRAKIKNFPFMASVHLFQKFHCGGSIIKADLVITAASCLQLVYNNRFFRENPSFLTVRVGSDFVGMNGEVIKVVEVYFHPSYSPKTLRNNLSIMRLERHLMLTHNKRVKKINFDRRAFPLSMTTDGIAIIGWGATSRANILSSPWTNRLSFSVLDVYLWRECQDIYSKEYVSRKHFCAGFLSKGGGACNHDVGNPGVVDSTLVGVASFGGANCGTPDMPTVFTKVGYYTDWIDEIIDMDVPTSWKRTTLQRTTALPTMPTEETKNYIQPFPGSDIEDSLKVLDQYAQENKLKLALRQILRDDVEKKPVKEDNLLNSSNIRTILNAINMVNKIDPNEVKEPVTPDLSTYLMSAAPSKIEATVTEKHIETNTNVYEKLKNTLKNIFIDINENNTYDDTTVHTLLNNVLTEEVKTTSIPVINPGLDTQTTHDDDIMKYIAIKPETEDVLTNKQVPRGKLKNSDSVMTLLFFTDDENNPVRNEEIFSDELLESKPARNEFQDLTFRNNEIQDVSTLFNESELNDMINDVLKKDYESDDYE